MSRGVTCADYKMLRHPFLPLLSNLLHHFLAKLWWHFFPPNHQRWCGFCFSCRLPLQGFKTLQLLKVSNKGNKQESAVTTGCAILRQAKYNFRICSDWSLNTFTAKITLKTYTRHTLLTRRLCETGFSASKTNQQQTLWSVSLSKHTRK